MACAGPRASGWGLKSAVLPLSPAHQSQGACEQLMDQEWVEGPTQQQRSCPLSPTKLQLDSNGLTYSRLWALESIPTCTV
eukprot:3675404-Amphidinium_carterae.1